MNERNESKLINWLKKYKRLIIGLITIILIILIVIFVDFSNLITNLFKIGLWGTLFFILIYTVAFLLRAYKVKLIFKGLNQPIKFSSSYFSIGASFLINDLTPGQLGDIAKVLILKDQEDMRLSESFAGIAVERVLDLLLLFSISCFALIYLYMTNISELEKNILLGQNLQFYLLIGAILIVIVLILFLISFYKQDFVVKIMNKVSKKLGDYLDRFLRNFKNGLKKFKDHKKEFLYVILLNIPTYIIDAFIVVIFFIFSGYNLNIFIIILATLVLFFSKIIPITPGGWAISELIGAFFIKIFYPEIELEMILSIFVIDHFLRTAYVLLYGGYSILHYNFKLKEARKILDKNNQLEIIDKQK
ncbi:MAG: YbhN family protein [Candidatus Hodarchaeota archaeon]